MRHSRSPDNLLAAGLPQSIELKVKALLLGAHARVADLHRTSAAVDMVYYTRPRMEKQTLFQRTGLSYPLESGFQTILRLLRKVQKNGRLVGPMTRPTGYANT